MVAPALQKCNARPVARGVYPDSSGHIPEQDRLELEIGLIVQGRRAMLAPRATHSPSWDCAGLVE
jgi:hypothetical protein